MALILVYALVPAMLILTWTVFHRLGVGHEQRVPATGLEPREHPREEPLSSHALDAVSVLVGLDFPKRTARMLVRDTARKYPEAGTEELVRRSLSR